MVIRKSIVEQGVYHITQRAPGREQLFIEEEDYLRFLKLLKVTSQKFSLSIFCFALLPNHVHILLKINDTNLNKAMKYLFQSYALSFNKKYKRKGHVFSGVYRASFCQDDSYLITASLYIHLNPYKAKLTSDIFNYKWFSLQPYIKPIESSFLKVDFMLDMLDNKNRDRAFSIYKKMLQQSAVFQYTNILEDQNAINKFYGNFLIWFKNNALNMDLTRINSFNSYLELERKIEEIRLKKRIIEPETKEAVIYLVEQLKARGYSLKDIAEKLGFGRLTIHRVLKHNSK